MNSKTITKASLVGGLVGLYESNLSEWQNEPTVLTDGIIMICRQGTAAINVNFDTWTLTQDSILVLFPNDVVSISHSLPTVGKSDVNNIGVCERWGEAFKVELLRYDADILREASLKMEQTVYDHLRHDRCRTDRTIVVDIINSMFALLQVYFRQPECTTLKDITLLQLKSFFLGFYDYTYRFPQNLSHDNASARMHGIFSRFMQLLEVHYLDSRDVQYYADLLNITPKYLGIIIRNITSHTAKVVITHYVTLQMKQSLRDTDLTIQQLSYRFHFEDPAFFCRFFKTHTGTTPQSYRNRLRGK